MKPDIARFKIPPLLILAHSEEESLFKSLGIHSFQAFLGFQILQTKSEAMLDVKCAWPAWRGNGSIHLAENNDSNNSKNKKNKQTIKDKKDRLKGLINYSLCQCHSVPYLDAIS